MNQRGQTSIEVVLGCGAIVLTGIALIVAAFALGWLNTLLGVGSGENVKQTYAVAYSDYQALQGTARNICVARKTLATAQPGDEKTQRQSQLTALENNYSRIEGEYDAAYQDGFRAKHIGPTDLPRTAPTEGEMLAQVGCV